MGVTNGFLKLSRDEFQHLERDQFAFAERAQAYDETNGYLDMDKAGFEIWYILDPSIVDPSTIRASQYPNIANIVGRGEKVFPDLDLGCGPAQVVDDLALRESIAEFDNLNLDAFLALASDELVAEMLMGEANEEEFREYHWGYLQSLGEFVKDAVANDLVVLRY